MKFTVEKFKEALANGPYAWPGGYPMYFVMADGEALSFKAAEENKDLIIYAIENNSKDDWHVIGYDINWEDENMLCIHSNNLIECAYPKDESEE